MDYSSGEALGLRGSENAAFVEATGKMQRLARDTVQRILSEKEKLSCELEDKKKKLDSWTKELNRCKAVIEREGQKLDEDVKQEKSSCESENDEEKARLHDAFVDETGNMHRLARDNVLRILSEKEKLSCELEDDMKKLDCWNDELNRLEALIERDIQKLVEDMKQKGG